MCACSLDATKGSKASHQILWKLRRQASARPQAVASPDRRDGEVDCKPPENDGEHRFHAPYQRQPKRERNPYLRGEPCAIHAFRCCGAPLKVVRDRYGSGHCIRIWTRLSRAPPLHGSMHRRSSRVTWCPWTEAMLALAWGCHLDFAGTPASGASCGSASQR
jgi:hypothetical protein